MEISTKMHWLELSTMIYVVRKQIKCVLVNKRPRDISLAVFTRAWRTCQSVITRPSPKAGAES